MKIIDYDPRNGDGLQGDVDYFQIPDHIALSTAEEIPALNGRLIIQEGKATGHHHAIELPRRRNFRQETAIADPVLHVRDTRLRKAFGGAKAKAGTARLYRDLAAVQSLVRAGELTRADLAIGILVVEGGPVLLSHHEHDSHRIPPGRYYVGRQVESAGAEERVVLD